MPFCYAAAKSLEVSTLVHRFGIFELETAAAELRRGGRRVPLQEQPLALLAALLERPGEIVTRDELRCRLWPPDVHVDFDNGINAAVARLREALDDAASNPRFVVTVPRRGYRFIAPVEPVEAPAPEVPPPKMPSTLRIALGGLAKLAALAGTALVLWIAAAAVLERWRREPDPAPGGPPGVRLAVLPFANLGTEPGREFLGDALTEELIALLGRLQPESLRVIARTSAMTYKGTNTGWSVRSRRGRPTWSTWRWTRASTCCAVTSDWMRCWSGWGWPGSRGERRSLSPTTPPGNESPGGTTRRNA